MSGHTASNAVATVLLSLSLSLAALSVSRCALAFWHYFSRFDASRDFKRPAGMLEGSGCRN